jgi:putative ABC transport system permease protein
MRWYQRWFRREAAERRLDAELRFHVEQRTADLAAAGVAPEEARRRARIELGGLEQVKEECRDVGAARMVDTLLQDLRYGLRQLRRNPGFAAVAILTLALGIGGATAVFSVVNGVLLRPLPYKHQARLVVLLQKVPRVGSNLFATPDFLAWRRQSFLPIAGITSEAFNLGAGGGAAHVAAAAVSANLFPMLGVRPALGRTFLPQEDRPDSRRVVILSYGLWQRDFGGSRDVIGKAVDLNGRPFTVIGVMPRGFRDPVVAQPQLWVPLEGDPAYGSFRRSEGVHWLFGLGSLPAGISLAQASTAIKALGARLGKEDPRTDARLGLSVTSLDDFVVGDVRPALLVVLAAVGFVLLIACANVAGLLAARGTARANELAVRHALGAGRARMVRQLLTESALVSLLGCGAGIVVGAGALGLLGPLVAGSLPRAAGVAMNARVLLFALSVSLLTGLAFGAAPALLASRPGIDQTLREGGRTAAAGFTTRRLQRLVIVSEVAWAVVLLVAAGLTVRSFRSLVQAKLGFNPRHILTLRMAVNRQPGSPQGTPQFYAKVLRRVRGLPGVESAAIARDLPLAGANPSLPFRIQGRPASTSGRQLIARYRAISSAYFRTMGIPLLAGRGFARQDARGAQCVTVVNRTMAHLYWPNRGPLGARIRPERGAPGWCTVVGVAGNVRKLGPTVPVDPTMYYSYRQVPDGDIPLVEGTMNLVVRSASPQSLAAALRRQVAAVDRRVPVYDMRTMGAIVARSRAQQRFTMALLGAFAALALALAAAGTYGTLSYLVTRRTREIGVRVALGARHRDVLRLVLAEGMRSTLIGLGIGITLALALARFMAGLLYGVGPADPLTFVGASAVLGAAALLASYLPARRAAKVDPMVALRCE